jgi:hypothetical protein
MTTPSGPAPTPSTAWRENVPPGEEAALLALAERLRSLQRRRAAGRPPDRALHAKGQCGLEAEFSILPDLPGHARAGMFAAPASFRAWVRVSNGSGARQHDARGDVRGLAVKVVGVPGPKIIPGMERATTQDFLLIQSPATPFRDAAEFVWLVEAAERPGTLLPRALLRFGPRRALQILSRLAAGVSRKVSSVATSRYFSALPVQYGPYAVRYALEPRTPPDPAAPPGSTPDYLAEELAARLSRGPVEWDFRVQFFVDEARTPIEDASRDWSEADAPFLTVGRLTLPRQDPGSPRGRRVAAFVEGLSFDPWHAGVDFRPLGNMMRARNHAYRLSTAERGASPEPDGTERLDD